MTYLGIKASERKERVLEILKRMNLSHRAKHFPQQLFRRSTTACREDCFHAFLSLKFSSLHRWEKGVEAFSFICTIYGVSFVMGILLVSLMQYHHLINSDMGIRTPGLVEAETWMSPEEAENMVNDLRRQPMVENATRSMHGVLGRILDSWAD